MILFFVTLFSSLTTVSAKRKNIRFFKWLILISFLLFGNFKSLQNENFAVLSERFSAQEKSLGSNEFLFFKLLQCLVLVVFTFFCWCFSGSKH